MQTHDGLHLGVTVYGPDDAPLTVFLAVDGLINSPADTVVGFYEDAMRHRLIRQHV